MAGTFYSTLFGDGAIERQERIGSRSAYARMEAAAKSRGDVDSLTDKEFSFISNRDSFYIASTTDDGWPYVQHRGGPAGFLKPIGGNRIAFGDFAGNKQYISAANLTANNRVALILVDYPAKRRLKLIGHATLIEIKDDVKLAQQLLSVGYDANVERTFIIDVIGLDWNCPQHMTQRFTEDEFAAREL